MANPRKLSTSQTDALGALTAGELIYTVAGWSPPRDCRYFASTTIYVLSSLGYCECSGKGLNRVAAITAAGREANAALCGAAT